MAHGGKEWRCIKCGLLLGILHGNRLHIRLPSLNVYYSVSLPTACSCRGCDTLNDLPAPEALTDSPPSQSKVYRRTT